MQCDEHGEEDAGGGGEGQGGDAETRHAAAHMRGMQGAAAGEGAQMVGVFAVQL